MKWAVVILSSLLIACTPASFKSQPTAAAKKERASLELDERWREFDLGNRLNQIAFCDQAPPRINAPLVLKDKSCRSELFPVVPGHYEGSIYIKIKDLPERVSANEAISIRLILFNADGEELPRGEPLEGNELSRSLTWGDKYDLFELNYSLNRVIDTSPFNSFSKITLLPRNYPVDAIWIPEDKGATYGAFEISVRDGADVEFAEPNFVFSKWNFPLLQRVLKFAYYEPQQFITPQAVSYLDGTVTLPTQLKGCLKNDMEGSPVVEASVTAWIESLDGALAQRECNLNIIIKRADIGHGAEAYKLELLAPSNIKITAPYPKGIYYAFQTLTQLIDSNEIREQIIIDYPDTEERAVLGKGGATAEENSEILGAANWLPEGRLNTLYIGETTDGHEWWIRSDGFKNVFAEIADTIQDDIFNLGYQINVYEHRREDKGRAGFTLNQLPNLKNLFVQMKKLGAEQYMLSTDDYVPTNGERFQYIGHAQSLGDEHRAMLNSLGNLPTIFTPPYYNNIFCDRSLGWCNEYFEKLQIAQPIHWTGATIRSLSIDAHHTARFPAKSELALWDNTLYARAHNQDFWGANKDRADLASYLEPYDVSMPYRQFSKVMINSRLNHIARIQLATAGAYLWNQGAYHPERTLWSYLALRFGPELSFLLLKTDSLLWERAKLQLQTSDVSSLIQEKNRKISLMLVKLKERGLDLALLTELEELVAS